MKQLPGPHNEMFAHFEALKEFINEAVDSHKKDQDRDNPRDYIDTFIMEMENVCEQLNCAHCVVSSQSALHSPLCLFSMSE